MRERNIVQILSLIHDVEALKKLLRHSWLSDGRQESVAEHTWRTALMAIVLAPELERELGQKIDVGHTVKIIIVHDLSEIHAGDHHAFKGEAKDRHQQEEAAIRKLVGKLPEAQREEIFSLWQEYEAAETIEGKLAKALDKMEVLVQHTEADIGTWTPKEYDYNFVHGEEETQFSKTTRTLRDLILQEIRQKMEKEGK